jgi:hypothetical protein
LIYLTAVIFIFPTDVLCCRSSYLKILKKEFVGNTPHYTGYVRDMCVRAIQRQSKRIICEPTEIDAKAFVIIICMSSGNWCAIGTNHSKGQPHFVRFACHFGIRIIVFNILIFILCFWFLVRRLCDGTTRGICKYIHG